MSRISNFFEEKTMSFNFLYFLPYSRLRRHFLTCLYYVVSGSTAGPFYYNGDDVCLLNLPFAVS